MSDICCVFLVDAQQNYSTGVFCKQRKLIKLYEANQMKDNSSLFNFQWNILIHTQYFELFEITKLLDKVDVFEGKALVR